MIARAKVDPVDILKQAIDRFFSVHAEIKLGNPVAWERYLEALNLLVDLRETHYWEKEIDLSVTRWPEELPKLPESSSVSVVMETLLASYAPWGLDLTLLLASNIQGGFDLKVLKPLGNLLYADAIIEKPRKENAPWNPIMDKLVLDRKLIPEKSKKGVFLRLYSPRVLEAAFIEQGLIFIKDYIIRWAPAFLALGSGGFSAAVLPALLGSYDMMVSWMDEEFKFDAATYLTYNLTKDVHDIVVSDTVAAFEDSQLHLLGQNLPAKGTNPLIVADILVTLAIWSYRWNPKVIRQLATGPKGYRLYAEKEQPNLPPIMVVGWVDGPLKPEKLNRYTVAGRFNRVWQLDYNRVYQEHMNREGLHNYVIHEELDTGGTNELRGWAFKGISGGNIHNKQMPWKDVLNLVSDELIPSVELIRDTAPYEQLIAFYLGKELIAMICTNRGIQESWDKVDLEQLGLDVVIEMKGEDFAELRVPLREYRGIRDPKTARRCAVHLFNENMGSTADNDLASDFQGELAELPQLLTCYSLALKDREGDREWLRIEVDFRAETAKAKRFFIDRYDSFWWGDGKEKIPWHQIEIPDDLPVLPFATCSLYMRTSYRYSVRGSFYNSGENFEGNIECPNFKGYLYVVGQVWQWQGDTASFSYRSTGMYDNEEGFFELTVGEQNTKIMNFKYMRRTEALGVTCRFEIVDIPLYNIMKLGNTGVAILVFCLIGDVKTHIKSFESKITQIVTETDPATNKEVQCAVTSEITSFCDELFNSKFPSHIGLCFVTHTWKQLQEMVKKGQLKKEVLNEYREKLKMAHDEIYL